MIYITRKHPVITIVYDFYLHIFGFRKRLTNKGVSACAVCDGFFFRNLEVAVVGAGDTAAEEALYLSKLCPKVHMIVRRDEMRASKIMQERVLHAKNIEVHWNSETVEILGENEVVGAKIKNRLTGEISTTVPEGMLSMVTTVLPLTGSLSIHK